jgi:carbonic anhydrase
MTSNQTINISKDNIYGKCDLKCAYNFQYNQSNSVATNNGISITLTYDKGNDSPVLFNNQKYFVSIITLYCPSIHLFNNSKANAELVIEHSPELGGEQLYVCIPIFQSYQSYQTSQASDNLTEIIQSVSNNAPSNGETTNLNMSNFNLNNFIPKKPFYNYTGQTGLVGQVIVFPLLEGISLNESSLESLTKIIQPLSLEISGGNLFFNQYGPNSDSSNNQGIYISCQPTGNSSEETEVTYTKSTIYDLDSIMNNPTTKLIFQILIGCILFILIFYTINFIFSYITIGSIKLPIFSLITDKKL